jgi:hypothetical protein
VRVRCECCVCLPSSHTQSSDNSATSTTRVSAALRDVFERARTAVEQASHVVRDVRLTCRMLCVRDVARRRLSACAGWRVSYSQRCDACTRVSRMCESIICVWVDCMCV